MSPQTLASATGCTLSRAEAFAPPLTASMQKWGIDSSLRQAAFLGQVTHESGYLSRVEENLHYNDTRLLQVWPKRFPTLDKARPYARNPQALAELVYGGRMGNASPGDGFKYRGRGLIQLTGKENYLAYMLDSGYDVLINPDLVSKPEAAADSACWFWKKNGCNTFADAQNWADLTRKINGGTVGLDDRIKCIKRALHALS